MSFTDTLKRLLLNSKTLLSPGIARSWSKLSKKMRKEQPYCTACGYTKKLQVHHIMPQHEYHGQDEDHPDMRLDPANLIVLCRDCHFAIGHRHNYKQSNKQVYLQAMDMQNNLKESDKLMGIEKYG